MTPIELNSHGFEGDSFLRAEIERLYKTHWVDTIIETGTYLGATTLKFAEMCDHVWTIESNPTYYLAAAEKFTKQRIFNRLGSSAELLPGILKTEHGNDLMFFLDAHWENNNPLLLELKAIADAEMTPIIIIHDFKVPGHPELGYDSYNGQDYDWSWIEQSIIAIYGEYGYQYHYNEQAEGAMRGVIFIEPKH
jgi:predicted O-methyltransferase YrrM